MPSLRFGLWRGRPHVKQGGLFLRMSPQFGQSINAIGGILLFALTFAFSFVPLLLLARLFFLTFIECRTASWHGSPPCYRLFIVLQVILNPDSTIGVPEADVTGRDSRRVLHRPNDARHRHFGQNPDRRVDVQPSVWLR